MQKTGKKILMNVSLFFKRYVIYKKSDKKQSFLKFPIKCKFSVNGMQTFFGYYDKTPFSLDGKKMLASYSATDNRSLKSEDELVIGYFDLENPENFHLLAKTKTWCWQLGCRLQWFPENENELIIYNTMVDGDYGSVIQNIRTKEIIRSFKSPIFDVDTHGLWAISLNFSRLHRLRPGYGYVNIPDATIFDPCPSNEGIWLINLISGEKQLIISIKDLCMIQPRGSMKNAEHYINHLSFNPSGDRFMFLHFWMKSGKRHSRLFSCDYNGQNLFLLENSGIVSHYTWKSSAELLIFHYEKDKGSHYYVYKDRTINKEIFGENYLIEDGHPTFSQNGRFLLTDTSYLDKKSMKRLIVYDLKKGEMYSKPFFNPNKYSKDHKCDLHPRWDRNQKYICFDSTHEGYRAMYLIKLNIA